MNLRELGALLKAEREKRGLSVREVMDATKISRRNVNALEEGNVGALPHPVYLKGYIKNYARLVGLDPEALSCVVDEQCDEEFERYLPQNASVVPSAAEVEPDTVPVKQDNVSAPEPEAEPEKPLIPALQIKQPMAKQSSYQPSEARTARSSEPLSAPGQLSSGGFRSFFVAILLLVALGALIIQYQRMQSQAQEAAATPAPVAQPAPQPVVNATAAVDVNATDQAELNAAPAPEAAPEAAQAPATAPEKAEKNAQASANHAAPASGIAVEQARTPGMQELTITAKPGEVCWVSVYDGVKSKSFTLRDGESRRFEYASTASVRLGNAGGVSFRVNGVAHPYSGQRGMTDTVNFGNR